MALTTYDELKIAIEATWPARSDLVSYSADFITLGESYLNRKLRCREMEESATINPSLTENYVSVPEGYMELISFSDDYGNELTEVSAAELEGLRYANDAIRPEYYRITSRIDFERLADQSYDFTMWYFKRLDLETDTSNAVLTAHPDLYLFAGLIQAEAFIKNDARIPLWKMALAEGIEDANSQSRKSRRVLRTEFGGSRSNILRG